MNYSNRLIYLLMHYSVTWVLVFIGVFAFCADNKYGEYIFLIGKPDESALEFGLSDKKWRYYLEYFNKPIIYEVGKNTPVDFPYIHPSNDDSWAGSKAHTYKIRFSLNHIPELPQFLIIGIADSHKTRSRLEVKLNDIQIGLSETPSGASVGCDPEIGGKPDAIVFPVKEGLLKVGLNEIAISLSGGSWFVYDYIYLGNQKYPLKPQSNPEQVREHLYESGLKNVKQIVFAARRPGADGHWYANISYYADCEQEYKVVNPACIHNGKRVTYKPGGKLGILDTTTGEVKWLIDDPLGSIRDPAVHYDGKTILFSWRKGNSEHFHLYTINPDGSQITQLTDGDYDDFEPAWLPDDNIVFVSTRAKRWVNCWITQVATLHRCDRNGRNIRPISANNEHDNTPWVLSDGRIIYQRWEYVDRSQVDYHHLWTANPDGSGQMVFFGNQNPGIVMIDAKPIPDSHKVVSIFSPGHGKEEHQGSIVVVSPESGPDTKNTAKYITRKDTYRDPWSFSETAFMAAEGPEIVLIDGNGLSCTLYRLPEAMIKEGYWINEPRPLIPRPREPIIPPVTRLEKSNGYLILANIYQGRNMSGVKPGEIKKLLILESLPKPINFTGGMDPLTYGGSFTLERVLGTVPVEEDGSAYFEVPALRSLILVALDENELAVKRMQSFLTVQPGEVLGCVGCHEQRTQTYIQQSNLMALKRAPSRIKSYDDCPDIFDFPRDIQPILNRLCVDCHDYTPGKNGGPYAGKTILSGDRGPMFSHSYFTLTVKRLFSDGRNEPKSNYPPRQLGSSASRILKMIDGSHYGVIATEKEKKMIRLWIETGAPYPGTYAALGSGSIGGYQENHQINTDFSWETTKAGAEVIKKRCSSCHNGTKILPSAISDEIGISFWRFSLNDPRLQFSRHILFNLSRPEKSLLVLAPLSKDAGGFGICVNTNGIPIFLSTADPDYLKLINMVSAGSEFLAKIKRFDMPGFTPRQAWYREMKRYGILPEYLSPTTVVDFYAVERQYWESLWYNPQAFVGEKN
ncbi:MAG: polysaccharide lyase family protein [Verrucomicrobiia bacterium]